MRKVLGTLLLGLIIGVGALRAGHSEAVSAPEAETYGKWSLETLKNGAISQLISRYFVDDAVDIASFGFVCDRRRPKFGKIGATLFPFKGLYNNQEDDVVVLIERSSNESDSSLVQKWRNGYKYIFLNQDAEVRRLVTYLMTAETDGIEIVNVLFSGDYNGRTETLLKVAVSLLKFSEAFSHLETTCAVKH